MSGAGEDIGVQPLSGLRVIDFSQVVLGPCATQVLADYGADVIKIERPGTGDILRSAISDNVDPDNPVFRSVNRNKRSIALDLRKPDGKAVVYDLIGSADVVVSNFRAGVIERMGFGYSQLSEMNPRIICAQGTGFGLDGPLSYKGGQDILAQAMSGVMMRRSNHTDPLSIYATSLCDYTAGMHLTQAILLALLQREKTGRGQNVSVSLFSSMLAMQLQEAAMWFDRGQHLNWGAYPLTGVFETTDGAVVLVDAFKENPLRDICAALAIPDLSLDPSYSTLDGQFASKPYLQSVLREQFRTNTTAYWLARLDEQDLLCCPVLTMTEALEHEQTRINGTVIADAQGARMIGTPLTMDPAAFRVRRDAPRLGEHSDAVLGEFGYDASRIRALRAQGIVS